MDLFDVIRSCVRRWYVVLPIIIGASWIAWTHYTAVKPVYYSNVVVGMAPPNAVPAYLGEGVPVPKNGLLEMGGPEIIANMAVLGYGDPAVKEKVVALGGKPNFTVRMFPMPITGAGAATQLPLIMMEATESDSSAATNTVNAAAAQADFVLHKLQQLAGVSDPLMARAIVLTPPSTAMGIPSRTRTAIGTVAVGIALAILSGVAADSLLSRLGARRRSRRGSTDRSQARVSSATSAELPEDQKINAS